MGKTEGVLVLTDQAVSVHSYQKVVDSRLDAVWIAPVFVKEVNYSEELLNFMKITFQWFIDHNIQTQVGFVKDIQAIAEYPELVSKISLLISTSSGMPIQLRFTFSNLY
jgi:hypothetical protein